jgi:hypothetical protein
LVDRVAQSGFKVLKVKGIGEKSENFSEEDRKQELEEVKTDSLTARDAFFAMVGIKMIGLAERFSKSLEDLHSLFFQVSCDWAVMEEILIAE